MDDYTYKYFTHEMNDPHNSELEKEADTPIELLEGLDISDDTYGYVQVCKNNRKIVEYSIQAFALMYGFKVNKINFRKKSIE